MKQNNDELLDKSVKKEEFLYPTYPEDDAMVSAFRPVSVVNLLRERDNTLDKIISLLVRGKTTLVVTTAIFMLVGSIIFLSIPLKFKTNATIISPTEDNIVVLNSFYSDVGLPQVTTREVYESFLINLRSKQNAKNFYDQFKVSDQLSSEVSAFGDMVRPINSFLENIGLKKNDDYADLFEQWFYKKMNITFPYAEGISTLQTAEATALNINETVARSLVDVELDGLNPDLISKWVNDYVNYINDITVNQFVEAGNLQAKVRERALAFEVESIENVLLDKKNQDISLLRQALSDAEKFGITTPVVGSGEAPFLRGSDMLRRQLQSLLANTPENNELNIARLEYRKITNLFVNKQDIQVMRVDSKAKPNQAYNNPTYILITSLILGLLFSFVVHSRSLTKERQA